MRKSPRIRLTKKAGKLISKFHPETKRLIKAALKELQTHPHAGHDLEEELSGFKSFSVKRYRIVYKVNEEQNTLDIYYAGHRRDVYEQFRLMLANLT
jgi:addiction module RelE/StbE family toxin